jgi:hypothetical protein
VGIEKLPLHDAPTGLMPKVKTPMRLSIKSFEAIFWISIKETPYTDMDFISCIRPFSDSGKIAAIFTSPSLLTDQI